MIRISKVCLWAACVLTAGGFACRGASAEDVIDLRPHSPKSVFSAEATQVADSWASVNLTRGRRQMKRANQVAAPPYVMPGVPDDSWGYAVGVFAFNSGPFEELLLDGIRTQGSVRNRLDGWGSEVDPAGSLYLDYGWSYTYMRGERNSQVTNPRNGYVGEITEVQMLEANGRLLYEWMTLGGAPYSPALLFGAGLRAGYLDGSYSAAPFDPTNQQVGIEELKEDGFTFGGDFISVLSWRRTWGTMEIEGSIGGTGSDALTGEWRSNSNAMILFRGMVYTDTLFALFR
jgi:hypothetical protein